MHKMNYIKITQSEFQFHISD